MTTPANQTGDAPAETPTGSIVPVIDLREGPTTRVRVQRDDNPFTALAPPERMRLIIRVLCELVAYDELDAGEERRATIRAAMDASEAPTGRVLPRPEPATGSGAPTSVTG